MTTFAASPADTGGIPLPAVEGRTHDLSAHAVTERIVARRPPLGMGSHTTDELPVWPTGAELAVQARADVTAEVSLLGALTATWPTNPPGNPQPGGGEPPPPAPKPPVAPGWNTPAGGWPLVPRRPKVYVGVRRHPESVAAIAAARVFWTRGASVLLLAVAFTLGAALAGCEQRSDGYRVPDAGMPVEVRVTPQPIPRPACGGVR